MAMCYCDDLHPLEKPCGGCREYMELKERVRVLEEKEARRASRRRKEK